MGGFRRKGVSIALSISPSSGHHFPESVGRHHINAAPTTVKYGCANPNSCFRWPNNCQYYDACSKENKIKAAVVTKLALDNVQWLCPSGGKVTKQMRHDSECVTWQGFRVVCDEVSRLFRGEGPPKLVGC